MKQIMADSLPILDNAIVSPPDMSIDYISTSSATSSPLLYRQNAKAMGTHLSRLASSIKLMLQENGLHDQYFLPDSQLDILARMDGQSSIGGISSHASCDTLDEDSDVSNTDEASDTITTLESGSNGCDLDRIGEIMSPLGQAYVYNPEKANLWVELTNIDVSPVLPKRRSNTFSESARQVLHKIDPSSIQRYPPLHAISQSPRLKSICQDHRCSRQTKDPNQGSLKFKFQYLIVTERLKVTVVSAANMLKCCKLGSEAYTYAEVCLMPGKLKRQQSKLVKATSDTNFDAVFYFQGLSLFEMHQMCLRIKIMAKERLLKTPKIIGEVTVSLDDFDLVSETTLDEIFNTRIGTRSGSRYGLRSILVQ